MTKRFTGSHAEQVGTRVVEPGDPIPDDADPAVVRRLTAAGLVEDDAPKAKPKPTAKE